MTADFGPTGEIMNEDQMAQCIPAKQYRQMIEKLTELEVGVTPTHLRIEALRAAARYAPERSWQQVLAIAECFYQRWLTFEKPQQ